MSDDKPKTVAEFMRLAHEVGHDALGIANDLEAGPVFARIRDPLDPTRKFSEGGAPEHRAALAIPCPICTAAAGVWCPMPGTTWNLCGERVRDGCHSSADPDLRARAAGMPEAGGVR